MATEITGEWQFVATLTVDGEIIEREWDSIDGGDTTSDTRSYRPGGDTEPVALPAAPATSDVILERAYRGEMDGKWRHWMAERIGKPAKVTVHAMRTTDRLPVPNTSETIRGILKEVTRPAFRSEGDGPALYRVVITPHGHWTRS